MARARKKGQTVIEFAFVSVLFIFMLVLTFNGVIAFCVHQYISYAAFMAARSYQASAATPEDQVRNAQVAFASYIPDLTPDAVGPGMNHVVYFPRFSSRKALATITGVQLPTPRPDAVGMRADSTVLVTFDVPFAELPLGSEIGSQISRISLSTRSALGREVTVQECQTYFQRRLNGILDTLKSEGAPGLASAGSTVSEQWRSMDDNGC